MGEAIQPRVDYMIYLFRAISMKLHLNDSGGGKCVDGGITAGGLAGEGLGVKNVSNAIDYSVRVEHVAGRPGTQVVHMPRTQLRSTRNNLMFHMNWTCNVQSDDAISAT